MGTLVLLLSFRKLNKHVFDHLSLSKNENGLRTEYNKNLTIAICQCCGALSSPYHFNIQPHWNDRNYKKYRRNKFSHWSIGYKIFIRE